MKKLIIITLLAVGGLVLSCQKGNYSSSKEIRNAFCGVDKVFTFNSYLDRVSELQQKYPLKTKRNLVFPVKIFLVAPAEKCSISQIELDSAFENLNQVFKPLHIQFKQEEEVSYIYAQTKVDDLYANMNFEERFTRKFYDSKFINLFIFQDYENVIGFTHYPILNINRLFIGRDKLTDASLVHEMGHFFGLLHTFEQTLSSAEIINDPNCDKNGDKICDTPADPFGASFLEEECKLFGDYKDGNGNVFSPDLTNYMSYYGKCRSRFTTEQTERMYFIASYVKWQQMRTGV